MKKINLAREIIRVCVFIFLISVLFILKFWVILLALVVFPSLLLNLKNKRSNKWNIGYLVNNITNHIVKKFQ